MLPSRFPIVDNIAFSTIQDSAIHGQGLFATAPIAPGAVLGHLDGQVIPWNPDMAVDFEWNALSDGTMLLRGLRTKYSFINHSRTPNLSVREAPLRVVAVTAIVPGEELTLDYREEPLPDSYLQGHGASYL